MTQGVPSARAISVVWQWRRMDARIGIANSLVAECGSRPQVEAVALGGSLAGEIAVEVSDGDSDVYLTDALPLETRAAIARARADCVEVGNDFWESGDEWIERGDELPLDVIYRQTGRAVDQLDRVLRRHPASAGYSTCIGHNLRRASILMDRSGWLHGVQRAASASYPEQLAGGDCRHELPDLAGHGVCLQFSVAPGACTQRLSERQSSGGGCAGELLRHPVRRQPSAAPWREAPAGAGEQALPAAPGPHG